MKFLTKLRPKTHNTAPIIMVNKLLVLPNMVCTLAVSAREGEIFSQDHIPSDVVLCYMADGIGVKNFGVLVHVLQVIKLTGDSVRLIIEGLARVRLGQVKQNGNIVYVSYLPLSAEIVDKRKSALERVLRQAWTEYAQTNPEITGPLAIYSKLSFIELVYRILAILPSLTLEQRIRLFLTSNSKEVVLFLIDQLQMTREIAQLKEEIDSRINRRRARSQREFYLQEQIREFQRELGDSQGDPLGVKGFEERFSKMQLSEEAAEKFHKELKYYARLQPASPETGLLRAYIETLLDLPWNVFDTDYVSLQEAKNILDSQHFGLEKPKQRILDFLAVRKINGGLKAPILCLVGPPGVGKTSLASSIAQCMGRQFVRLSLGGVRDETEIRGHRRTYIGSLPGKIIQTLQKAKTSNPVFLLDEIDKMSHDGIRGGDPGSALLEVLDPEQNTRFVDTYLEVAYDLSQVLFVATANSLNGIPYPLLDRLEVIELSGYSDLEKTAIAQKFIIPKKIHENGLDGSIIQFHEEAIHFLIHAYTNESGVRQLEREINSIIRKLVREKLEQGILKPEPNQVITEEITPERVRELLGKRQYQEDDFVTPIGVGMAMGLAWTELGGRVLPIEVRLFAGDGKLLLTGKLGDVMKESAQIAMSFLRDYAKEEGLSEELFRKNDIHIHVPEGATPKDGPSAGIAIAAAIFSALSGKKPLESTAMTGEITLSGYLLPIGGLKEKTLAANRHRIEKVLIPQKNTKDLEDIPAEVREQLEIIPFEKADEALNYLFN